jgi:hypothetical protein
MTGKKEDPLCSCPATKLIVSGTQYFKHGKLGCCPDPVTHSEYALLSTVNNKSQRKSYMIKYYHTAHEVSRQDQSHRRPL